jgi:predicted Na+-dependent transporter
MAAIMYLGRAFDGDLGFPVAVYLVIVLIVSALLRAYLRDKDAQHSPRLFGRRR